MKILKKIIGIYSYFTKHQFNCYELIKMLKVTRNNNIILYIFLQNDLILNFNCILHIKYISNILSQFHLTCICFIL